MLLDNQGNIFYYEFSQESVSKSSFVILLIECILLDVLIGFFWSIPLLKTFRCLLEEMLSLRLFRVRLSTTRLWQVCNITIISACFMLLRVKFFFQEIYDYGYDKKICKTCLVLLCWWSTLCISIEQNVMVSLHWHLPTIYITVNKAICKWFGLGPSSVGEMIVPRHTKIVRVRTHRKGAHAERSYKVNKGVLRHVKTIDSWAICCPTVKNYCFQIFKYSRVYRNV